CAVDRERAGLCLLLPLSPRRAGYGRDTGTCRNGSGLATKYHLGGICGTAKREARSMTIGINGMAHVILTVSRFEVAREFYRKLLPEFRHEAGVRWRRVILLRRRLNRDRHRTLRSGAGWRALRAAARWPASSLPACAFARGRGPVRRSAKRNERDHRAWSGGRTVGSRILLCPI